jgi:hypothetical protein
MPNPNPVLPPVETRFKAGVSANPGGKPVGARNRVTGAFLNDLAELYTEKGKTALSKLIDDDPRTFFKALVSLCPKQLEAVNPLEGLQDPTLQGLAYMFQAYLAARQVQPVGVQSQPGADEAGNPGPSV